MKTGTSSLMDSHLVDFTNPNANNIKSSSTTSKKVIRIDDINEEVDELIRQNELTSSQTETQGYICPVTKVQCDDECCTSPENCNIDNEEFIHPISADCEEVKNWDNFVEEKNKELYYLKQVMNPYPTGSPSYYTYEKGFIEGYKKAQYTQTEISDEEIEKAANKSALGGYAWQKEKRKSFKEGSKWYRDSMVNQVGSKEIIQAYKEHLKR